MTTVTYDFVDDEWYMADHETVSGYIGDEAECLEWPEPEGYEEVV